MVLERRNKYDAQKMKQIWCSKDETNMMLERWNKYEAWRIKQIWCSRYETNIMLRIWCSEDETNGMLKWLFPPPTNSLLKVKNNFCIIGNNLEGIAQLQLAMIAGKSWWCQRWEGGKKLTVGVRSQRQLKGKELIGKIPSAENAAQVGALKFH